MELKLGMHFSVNRLGARYYAPAGSKVIGVKDGQGNTLYALNINPPDDMGTFDRHDFAHRYVWVKPEMVAKED